MNNQELYAKGFKDGWNKHRKYICKEYGWDEIKDYGITIKVSEEK